MLFVVVGNNIPKDWTFDYEFPEHGLLPKQLAQIGMEIIDKSRNTDISIHTVSPMLIELLNTVATECLQTQNRYFLDTSEIDPDNLYMIYNVLGNLYRKINMIKIINRYDDHDYDKEVLIKILTKDLY